MEDLELEELESVYAAFKLNVSPKLSFKGKNILIEFCEEYGTDLVIKALESMKVIDFDGFDVNPFSYCKGILKNLVEFGYDNEQIEKAKQEQLELKFKEIDFKMRKDPMPLYMVIQYRNHFLFENLNDDEFEKYLEYRKSKQFETRNDE
jgi:hypothetical protein